MWAQRGMIPRPFDYFQCDLIPPHRLQQQGFGCVDKFLLSNKNSVLHTGHFNNTISLCLWSFILLYFPDMTCKFSILSSILSPFIWSTWSSLGISTLRKNNKEMTSMSYAKYLYTSFYKVATLLGSLFIFT